MTRPGRLIPALLVMTFPLNGAASGTTQKVPLEYQVKAAYLFNFTKFVDWPAQALPEGAPLTICVASPSPFGRTLEELIVGETVAGRALVSRVVHEPDGCHVLFVPRDTPAAALLRHAQSRPILTVGESSDFVRAGGIVRFVMEDGRVRFEISQEAASGAQLRISSRLLRLARPPDTQ